MRPSPRAETSRLLFPSVRFFILSPSRPEMARSHVVFRATRLDAEHAIVHAKYAGRQQRFCILQRTEVSERVRSDFVTITKASVLEDCEI